MATHSSEEYQCDKKPIPNDVYAHYGRHLIQSHLVKVIPILGDPHRQLLESLRSGRPPPMKKQPKVEDPNVVPVGILGAGPGGLYAALILDSLGIKYQILEASGRTGGRLFTHHFSDAEYDYYDVGAMRYPDNLPMTRLFNLFCYPPLNQGDDPLRKRLIPFYFTTKPVKEADRGFLYYNGARERDVHGTFAGDPFKAAQVIQDVDPEEKKLYISAGVGNIVEDVYDPFVTGLLEDLKNGTKTGWDYLMTFDKYSTRAYMALAYKPSGKVKIPLHPLSNDVINWCETFDNSTAAYDRALSEGALDAVAFDADKDKWWCLRGGSQVLSDHMQDFIQKKDPKAIAFNQQVVAIRPDGPGMQVTAVGSDGKSTNINYGSVISTLPLTCLRTLDIYKCDMSPLQANALRELDYGPSIKIGIKFKTAWWVTGKDKDGNLINIVGGQSFTDRPIRTVVYPSYSFSDPTSSPKTTVLIASYCWTNDAERLGSLIATGKQQFDQQLLTLAIRDLADVHNLDYDWLFSQIENPQRDVFAWDWNHDPLTQGAFAYYGPGKFQNLYESLSVPAGNLYFAGEAVSPRHAWVVGAFDSVWQAICIYLLRHHPEKLPQFFIEWGFNMEWIVPGSPYHSGDGTIKPEDNLLLAHLIVNRPDLFM